MLALGFSMLVLELQALFSLSNPTRQMGWTLVHSHTRFFCTHIIIHSYRSSLSRVLVEVLAKSPKPAPKMLRFIDMTFRFQ